MGERMDYMFHKKIIALLIILFSVLVTTACGGAIDGTYTSQERPNDYIELRGDGTFFIMEKGQGLSGTFKQDETRLVLTSPSGASSIAELRGETIVDNSGLIWAKGDLSAGPLGEEGSQSGAELQRGMQGAFERGSFLWYWYDGWIAVPFMLAGLVLTLRLGQAIRRSELLALASMLIAILAIIPVIVVVFDRIGIWNTFSNPVTFGYASIAGTAVAILLGIAIPWLVMRKAHDTAEQYLAAEAPIGGELASASPNSTLGGMDLGRTASPEGNQALVSIRNGRHAGRRFSLSGVVTTIGRSSDNALVLEDRSVSRYHARITHEGSEYFLEDAGSTAGTFLEGVQVSQRVRLNQASVIRLGDTELAFQAPTDLTPDVTQISSELQSGGETMVLGQEKSAAWLLAQKGNQAGQSFVLRDQTTTIGRSDESSIRLDDAEVSLNHALITKGEEGFQLYDTGSSSGTRLNEQKLTGVSLQDGSTISIGSSELEFSVVEGGAPLSPGATLLLNRQERRGTLLVRSGPAAGQSFPLDQDLVVGREPGPTGAAIDDPAISRRHMLVRNTPEGFLVYDLGSANGTTVDGTNLLGQPLSEGDIIQMGSTVLQFGMSVSESK